MFERLVPGRWPGIGIDWFLEQISAPLRTRPVRRVVHQRPRVIRFGCQRWPLRRTRLYRLSSHRCHSGSGHVSGLECLDASCRRPRRDRFHL